MQNIIKGPFASLNLFINITKKCKITLKSVRETRTLFTQSIRSVPIQSYLFNGIQNLINGYSKLQSRTSFDVSISSPHKQQDPVDEPQRVRYSMQCQPKC
jgi:hypothetical protein